MLKKLKKEVYKANMELYKSGLIILTWGNVSGIDETRKYVVIKPSGVPYEKLKVKDMVVTDLDGNIIEGKLKPSVDLPTHLEIYKAFKDIKGITHTHSTFATAFAQACKEIPCFGTTQADTFHGAIPLTRLPNDKELEDYTKNIGKIIVERFKDLNEKENPGTICAKHGVFSWGKNAIDSTKNALIIEQCAKMAYLTLNISKDVTLLPDTILDLHYQRKHGKNKTYGQEEK